MLKEIRDCNQKESRHELSLNNGARRRGECSIKVVVKTANDKEDIEK